MAPLKFFRVHLCHPVYMSANGVDIVADDFDWRDYTYVIKDISVESIDLSKKYQVFVEHFTLNTNGYAYTGIPFSIESPSFVDPTAFHSSEIDASGVILLHGRLTDYHASITADDVGIPVSLDFLRRRQLQIRLRALGNKAFDVESQIATNLETEAALGDQTHYNLTLLFTQLPESLQAL